MTTSEDHTGQVFTQKARQLLKDEYLPKIERCLERLTDEQIWWRPNPDSNSIGNLMLRRPLSDMLQLVGQIHKHSSNDTTGTVRVPKPDDKLKRL